MSKTRALRTSDDLLICIACGSQYNVSHGKEACKVSDDPRQFVPPAGQLFTSLADLRRGHKNVWWQDEVNPKVWFVKTEPEFAIGIRAMLIQSEQGNILWDLIPLLDQKTVNKIQALGGLSAIIVSHPHYYSTWADWSSTFECPVYVGGPDREWLERTNKPAAEIRFFTETYTPLLETTVILAGGHFPEPPVHRRHTLHGPSASNPVPGKPGVISYTFFRSIPDRVPLKPDAIFDIWKKLKSIEFHTTFGAFRGMDVRTMENESARRTGGVKGRLLESCKIFVKAEFHEEHAIMAETLEQ